jgi:hypothetical protein
LKQLLRLSRGIDCINSQLAVIATWLVLIACLVQRGQCRQPLSLQRKLEWLAGSAVGTCLPPWCCTARPTPAHE